MVDIRELAGSPPPQAPAFSQRHFTSERLDSYGRESLFGSMGNLGIIGNLRHIDKMKS